VSSAALPPLPSPALPALALHVYETDGAASSSALASADLGVAHVGPSGLLRHLATTLGLPLPAHGHGERVAAMDRRLASLDDSARWFSESRGADRWGVAAWFVRTRDSLRLLGWDGRAPLAGSPRLDCVSTVAAAGLLPGAADAWHELLAELPHGSAGVRFDLRLHAPRAAFAPILRRVLGALAASGHAVSEGAPPGGAPPGTDLGRLQRALASREAAAAPPPPPAPLRGDGSLVLLEADSPVEAALLATRLAPGDPLASCNLVSAEGSLLEFAREEAGLPPLGLAAASRHRPALQVLPLLIELAFSPRDPATALQLLHLPATPVPAKVRSALRAALRERPAVEGKSWRRALDEGLAAWRAAAPRKPAEQAAVAARLAVLFPEEPSPADPGAAASTLLRLAETVADWARARGGAGDPPDGGLLAAARIASDFAGILGTLPPSEPVSRLAARQLHDLAAGAGHARPNPPRLGAPLAVEDPAAVPAEVEDLLWFGLVAGAAERPAPMPWSEAERAGLAAAGCELDEWGAGREREEHAWLRPVRAATRRLILVSWRSAGTEAAEPHPLLDLLAARAGESSLRACRLGATELLAPARPGRAAAPAVASVAIPPAPGLAPREVWTLPPSTVPTPKKLSFSQIETLLLCPLRWTLQYAAGLRPGGVETLPGLDSYVGTFGHSILQRVLLAAKPSFSKLDPALAREQAEQEFDRRVAEEAAPLLLPGRASLRERMRRQIGEAAAELVVQVQAGGWAPDEVEAELNGTFAGLPFGGSADLTLKGARGRRALVDIKKSSFGKRDALAEGRALQLALYARGMDPKKADIPAAYVFTRDSSTLSAQGDAFPKAQAVDGPDHRHALADAERIWRFWWAALQKGHVAKRDDPAAVDLAPAATAAGLPAPESPWHEEGAPCGFCDQRRICQFSNGNGAPAGPGALATAADSEDP
jgi:hypothetical protein